MIKRIVPHGTVVSKGENLVWFEREEIDKKIKDADIALQLAKFNLEGEVFDYEQFLKSQQLDKEAAERSRQAAQQDYDNFVEVDRERQLKSAAFSLKSSLASLENAQEELKQLEQMYKEDDLTEESEEIVLKRAKQAVESAQFRLESTEIQIQRMVDQGIPRQTADPRGITSAGRDGLSKVDHELNLARQRREIELAQAKDKFEQQEKDLVELKEERKRMVLTSPIDGIALHGKLNRGRLGDKPSTLETGSKVTNKQVLITVVDPKRLQIRAVDLDEKELGVVKEGVDCKVTIQAFPELKATGTVKSISMVPYAGNKYDCVVTLHAGKDKSKLLPTMGCELVFEEANGTSDQADDEQPSEDSKAKDEDKKEKDKEAKQ